MISRTVRGKITLFLTKSVKKQYLYVINIIEDRSNIYIYMYLNQALLYKYNIYFIILYNNSSGNFFLRASYGSQVFIVIILIQMYKDSNLFYRIK